MAKIKKLKSPILVISFSLLVICCLFLVPNKFPISRGDVYFHRLQQYYLESDRGNWSVADRIALSLDPDDIAHYRSLHHPDELKKLINSLVVAPNKSVEDLLELSRIQAILGKNNDSLETLSKAHALDPIRDDITQLYYQTKK